MDSIKSHSFSRLSVPLERSLLLPRVLINVVNVDATNTFKIGLKSSCLRNIYEMGECSFPPIKAARDKLW